ncbi:MAG: amidohydrolase [Candidatus Tectimicrobiota bacterium]|nr:MAG: amidohydrolase [Candidatus Tectomicrobia bacterium]
MSVPVTTPIISADSHMLEPPDLWVQRLAAPYRERAPRVYWDEGKNGWFFGGPGVPPIRAAGLFGAGKTDEELADHWKKGYEAARPGGWDPAERLKDMALDGVAAEVLYTSLGFNLFWITDADFQEACFRVYNDWLAEFVSHDPTRFAGLGLISLWRVDHAVEELQRCRRLGLRGAMIWASPPAERPFTSRDYDPFWAAAQDLDMPISLHILTGQGWESKGLADESMDRYQRNLNQPAEIQRSLTALLFSGVLERFPRLKIVSAENDIGWVAYYLYRADRAYKRFRHLSPTPLTMPPSAYFRRQVYATFMDDPVGTFTVALVGADNFMWSSDYPHQASTWPHSREVIARDFKDLGEEETRKIVHDNCAELYGFTV